MLVGNRIFGHLKTSQGGHQLTNSLLRKFMSDKSNWKLEILDDKNKDSNKDNSFMKPVAVNA